jgi:GT2 family glycosyltransferase
MTPHVSIIIPTYRRSEALARTLDAMARLDYPRDALEVVVVEDEEPDHGLNGRREPRPDGLRVTWLSQCHAGPASARNRGARTARFDVLAFADDDCQPHPNWITELTRALGENPRSMVGGHTVNALTDNAYSRASQALVTYITAYYMQTGSPFLASNNIAMSRATFEELGGFDTTFGLAGGEDRDFCARCLEHGIELRFVPEAIIEHHHELSLGRFWRQHHRYGRGAFQFHSKRNDRAKPDSLEPLRFYSDLVFFPFRQPGEPHPLRVSTLLCVSQVANALGFFSARRKSLRKR